MPHNNELHSSGTGSHFTVAIPLEQNTEHLFRNMASMSSVWRCFAKWEPTRTEALAGQMAGPIHLDAWFNRTNLWRERTSPHTRSIADSPSIPSENFTPRMTFGNWL